jgi:RNA polymerase sigma-70 factor (ECF subfamily)
MDAARREAFERTSLPHLGSVAFLAERLAGGAGPDADDLAQETFLRAWAAFDRFTPGTNARTWLLTIALNAFRDRMRRRGRDPLALESVAEPQAPEPPPASPLPLETVLDDRLTKALDALPPVSRAVLVLAVIEEVPRQEIARTLGCPEGTVRSLLSRARSELRRRLAP